MKLRDIQSLELPATADMHVHLRQGEMSELVVPSLQNGGVDTAFVMALGGEQPNLQPPITSVAQALEYKARLQAIEPRVQYLMSLFLHPSITPEVIAEAASAGITGVKLYPQGVTTNSDSGVLSIEDYAHVFSAMEKHDLVLNLHGEMCASPSVDISLEESFLPTLKILHETHPKLRIVLEHCSTSAALDAVRACGPTVAATITAHHLYLTGNDSKVDPLAFCKPIPKKPSDRDALIKAVCSGDPEFFFGSDSAPHPLSSKTKTGDNQQPPAGVFTQPYATQLVLLALEEAIERDVIGEEDITQERLEGFLGRFGRKFYKLPEYGAAGGVIDESKKKIVLERKGEKIPKSLGGGGGGGLEVGISRAGSEIFSLRWVD